MVTLRYRPGGRGFPEGRCIPYKSLKEAQRQAEADLEGGGWEPTDIVQGAPGKDPFGDKRKILWSADE